MTLIWFVIWLIWNVVGDEEPLTFDPVNWWAGTLLLALALDLGRQHAPPITRKPGQHARRGLTRPRRSSLSEPPWRRDAYRRRYVLSGSSYRLFADAARSRT